MKYIAFTLAVLFAMNAAYATSDADKKADVKEVAAEEVPAAEETK